MESVVLVLMILVGFNFVLKQSFCKVWSVVAISAAAAIFVGSMWGYAIEQSKTQIGAWLSNSTLMLDTSVILSIEVVLQLVFCILAANIATTGSIKPRTLAIYRFLRWFPGLLIFPVLFSGLVYAIFSLPGYTFSAVSWSLASVVLIAIPLLAYGIRWLLPEKEIRLELLFLTNVLVAILGVIATVNGRTAVTGLSSIDWSGFGGLICLIIIGGVMGLIIWRIKLNKTINKKI